MFDDISQFPSNDVVFVGAELSFLTNVVVDQHWAIDTVLLKISFSPFLPVGKLFLLAPGSSNLLEAEICFNRNLWGNWNDLFSSFVCSPDTRLPGVLKQIGTVWPGTSVTSFPVESGAVVVSPSLGISSEILRRFGCDSKRCSNLLKSSSVQVEFSKLNGIGEVIGTLSQPRWTGPESCSFSSECDLISISGTTNSGLWSCKDEFAWRSLHNETFPNNFWCRVVCEETVR